jgi:hypothetical protein
MKRRNRLIKAICAAILTVASLAYANVRVEFPAQIPGPPGYSIIERGFIPHTDDWAAVPFVRQTACVPLNFNLLDFADLAPAFPGGPPRSLLCDLTVEGHAIFKNGPPPVDIAPIQTHMQGLGTVAIWFVSTEELATALQDDILTIAELTSLPSLRIGSAAFFELTQQPGPLRKGFGTGKIELNATGTLIGGGSFEFRMREMGIDGQSVLRHIKIEVQ